MPYLPNFDYDIFISYAHANNDYPKGWVTDFHEALQRMLNASVRGVTIWRDNNLDSNTCFDAEIEERIKNAAIFVTLYSGAYHDSDYCRKELQTFHSKAQVDGWGLSIKSGNRSRIINVLLRNIGHEEWPVELKGTTGRKFHGPSNWPLNQKTEAFEKQLQGLTDELVSLLRAFKETPIATTPAPPSNSPTPIPPAPPADGALTVFLATASSSLEDEVEHLLNVLKEPKHGVAVTTGIPPPYSAEEHDRQVQAELGRSHLAIHLLAGTPDEPIRNLSDAAGQPLKTYYSHRQIELGFAIARPQLIWLPDNLEVDKVEHERHKQFLLNLESGKYPPTAHLVKSSRAELAQVALDAVAQIRQEAQPQSAGATALLDYRPQDRYEAHRLEDFLYQRGVQPLTRQEVAEPKRAMAILQELIREANRLIIVYSDSDGGRDWVNYRAGQLLALANINNCLLEACGIYFVQPRAKNGNETFRLYTNVPVREFDSHDISNPQALKALAPLF